MLIIGVDPGSRKTGYGIIEWNGNRLQIKTFGTIAPAPQLPVSQRLEKIYNGLCAVLAQARPDEAAVEEVFYSRNAKSALILGQARGVALLALQQAGVKIYEYASRKVKQGAAGFGAASKDQIQYMVKHLFRIKEETVPEDAADALAIALCHSHTLPLRSKIKK